MRQQSLAAPSPRLFQSRARYPHFALWRGAAGFGGCLVRDLSFENQFVILRCSISTRARSKYLNEAPAIPRMLANLLLILDFRRAPRAQPTFAEPDKLVFIFWFHNCQIRTCR